MPHTADTVHQVNTLVGDWHNPASAAAALGVTRRTIDNYIATGALPAYRLAGQRLIRIRATDLAALLEPVAVAK